MPNSAKPIDVKKYTLSELLNFVEKYNVGVPDFQRGFVWRRKKIVDLFDSLIKKYPIGSFVIWKTNKQVNPRYIRKIASEKRTRYLIIDGQQRICSIYYLCRQDEFVKVQGEFSEFYDGTEKTPTNFSNFYFEEKPKELLYSTEIINQFNEEEFRRKLGNYVFPVIIVSLDDFEKAQKIFERINQSGQLISTEDIFLSESWNQKTELGKILRKWKKKNKKAFSTRLNNIIFIHLLSTILQLENGSETVDVSLPKLKNIAEAIRNGEQKDYKKIMKKVLSSIIDAMTFLREEYEITSIDELPSQTMMSVLSVFFYYSNGAVGRKKRKELKKWFWRSSLGSRYIGANYNKNIRDDPFAMKNLAKYGYPLDVRKEKIYFEKIFEISLSSGKSAIKSAIKLMLWLMEPKWLDGKKIPRGSTESLKRKKEDDHFYPYNFFDKEIIKNENEINSILNLNYLPKEENAKKNKDLPSKWLKEIANELESSREDERIFFRSHLLPFNSIKDLEEEESGHAVNDLIRKNDFRYYYNGKSRKVTFLKKRFKKFRKQLNRLQDGKDPTIDV